MKLQDLLIYAPNIKFIKKNEWPEEILAISALDALLESSLVFIKNNKFLQKLLANIDKAVSLKIGVILDEKFFDQMKPEFKVELEKLPWLAVTPQLSLALTQLSKPFYDKKMANVNTQVDGRQMGTTDIHPGAFIGQNVFIGEYVKIGSGAEIMPGTVILPFSEIGENTKVYPNVTIYPFTKIGSDCRIHSGVVIGSDGFGYTFDKGSHLKIWHTGGVIVHDNVEIGSNSSIDMGTFSPTIIGQGTRIDNLVQIAHNVKIGRGCILCGQSGVAGSVVLEDYVILGGRAAVGPDTHIGAGSQLAGGAKVGEGAVWPPGSKLGGHPAKDLKEWIKGVAYLRNVSLREKSKE